MNFRSFPFVKSQIIITTLFEKQSNILECILIQPFDWSYAYGNKMGGGVEGEHQSLHAASFIRNVVKMCIVAILLFCTVNFLFLMMHFG